MSEPQMRVWTDRWVLTVDGCDLVVPMPALVQLAATAVVQAQIGAELLRVYRFGAALGQIAGERDAERRLRLVFGVLDEAPEGHEVPRVPWREAE